MNRILVIVVILLVPFAVFQEKKEVEVFEEKTQAKSLELQKNNIAEILDSSKIEPKKESYEVMISNNRDKSNAYSIDLEEYIIGVVAGEMPASFNEEALKAQAVASRTYALYKSNNIDNYVLSTNISDQVYLSIDNMKKKWGSDFDYYYNRVKKAVEDTKGEVLKYQDKLAITYYFAISNGYTDDGGVVFNDKKDYLVSVDSSWDKNYNCYYSSFSMLKSNFCNSLGISCNGLNVSNVVRSSSHYVREITINDKKFSGLEVFNKLNLKSTDFEIIPNGNSVIIKTYGFGHGVGMSQYGAQGMASAGKNYEDILTHYYKNTQISAI